MIDAERARRTALTADLWETVRAAREAPEPNKRRPWPRRRWLLVAAAAALVGAGSVAVHDLSTPMTQTTKKAKPQRAAHPARAARMRTHAPAATSSRHARKTAVAEHGALKNPAHPTARAARIRTHAPAVTSSRHATKTAVAEGAALKNHNAAVNRNPAARPTAPVHTHPAAGKTDESPKPTRKSHVQPHIRRNVPSSPSHPGPKTFAWLKVAGAAGYRVALFKTSGAILFRDTKTPRLTVSGTWRYEGKPQTLSPGRYRWYVWSLDARGRASTRAIVSSALVIGR